MNETNVHQMPGCDTVFDLLSWLSGGGGAAVERAGEWS